MLNLTLEQARTLDAVVRHGSYAKAAAALNKVHTAVVYSLKGLEDAAGVALFDRSGYRTALTPVGQRVLELCRKLLETEGALEALCRGAREGYEPFLKVVFDGLFPVETLLEAVRLVGKAAPATRISLFSEFLQGVDARFESETADAMISLLPPAVPFKARFALAPIPSVLVAHKTHALAKARGRLTLAELSRHTFLTVHGSDTRLAMSTSALETASVFHLSDFHAKKAALELCMGFGWMPEYLIERELALKELIVVAAGDDRGRHVFRPVLYVRETSLEGKACQALVAALGVGPV